MACSSSPAPDSLDRLTGLALAGASCLRRLEQAGADDAAAAGVKPIATFLRSRGAIAPATDVHLGRCLLDCCPSSLAALSPRPRFSPAGCARGELAGGQLLSPACRPAWYAKLPILPNGRWAGAVGTGAACAGRNDRWARPPCRCCAPSAMSGWPLPLPTTTAATSLVLPKPLFLRPRFRGSVASQPQPRWGGLRPLAPKHRLGFLQSEPCGGHVYACWPGLQTDWQPTCASRPGPGQSALCERAAARARR